MSFVYNCYGTDGKLHPRRGEPYIINPYQMVATNGKYYLICNYDKYNEISNYRVDRITDIKILDEPAKPLSRFARGGLNLPKHMAEHIYMFSGEASKVKFKAKTYIVDQIVEWFGTDVKLTPVSDEECIAEVRVNREAFFYWAMQYGMHIEVTEPLDIRERISNAVREMNEKYNG